MTTSGTLTGRKIGSCSLCGGDVVDPYPLTASNFHPTCLKCGATKINGGPVIPMERADGKKLLSEDKK